MQINSNQRPIIIESNPSNKTWNIPIEQIPVTIGNHILSSNNHKYQTITLDQYLSKFDNYISTSIENKHINLLRSDNTKDIDVIVSSQCCLMPTQNSKSASTKFNIITYNHQSNSKDPSMLVIVSTSQGTSAQIIHNQVQTLLFNDHGKKCMYGANIFILAHIHKYIN